jgi:hypothetical protein
MGLGEWLGGWVGDLKSADRVFADAIRLGDLI